LDVFGGEDPPGLAASVVRLARLTVLPNQSPARADAADDSLERFDECFYVGETNVAASPIVLTRVTGARSSR
jgi:hypothetical protein